MSTKYIRGLMASLALSLAVGVTACGPDEDELAQDTSLLSDLELAGQDTTAEPELSDVPPAGGQAQQPRPSAPRPSAPRPSQPTNRTPSGNTVERTPAGGGETVAAVPAGTRLALNATSQVCTNTNKVGDTFVATLAQPVTAGGVTIPAGAQVRLRITELKKSENVNDRAVLAFVAEQIRFNGTSFPLKASIASADVNQVRTSSTGSDAKKVIGGAVVGAVVGQILGKDTKSTVIGAATGAAAGAGAAVVTGDYDACIPQGGNIAITLTDPLTVTAN